MNRATTIPEATIVENGKTYIVTHFFGKTVIATIEIWESGRMMCRVDGRAYDVNEQMGNGAKFWGPIDIPQ